MKLSLNLLPLGYYCDAPQQRLAEDPSHNLEQHLRIELRKTGFAIPCLNHSANVALYMNNFFQRTLFITVFIMNLGIKNSGKQPGIIIPKCQC